MTSRLFRLPSVSGSERRRSGVFTEREFLTLTSYLDALLPESPLGPSASGAGVPAYIESLCSPAERSGWRLFRRRKIREGCAATLAFYRRLIARLDEIADEEHGRPFFLLSREEQTGLIAEFANTSERDVLLDDVGKLLPEELADSDLYRLSRVYAIQGYFAHPKADCLRALRSTRVEEREAPRPPLAISGS
jgi:hypothetical protein